MNVNIRQNFVECLKFVKETYGEKQALADQYNQYSFCELYEYSGKIALHINDTIKGYENCIGVIADGSAQSVILMIGVICSGNFYLPIDAKIHFLGLKDIADVTNMKMILTANDKFEHLEDILNCYSFESILSKTVKRWYFADIDSDAPLYAVLTSGSTGKPKIVLKTHKAMMLYMSSFVKTFSISEREIVGNQIPFYSDAAQKDLFLMLYLGVGLILIPQYLFSAPYALVKFINEHDINYISWVPSAYGMISQFDIFRKEQLTKIRYSFWVGERINRNIVEYWKKFLPKTRFYNIYGMSEIAGVCAYYDMSGTIQEPIPIGIPFEHCILAFMDENKQLSDRGELLVWSDALGICVFTEKGKLDLDRVCICFGNEKRHFYKTGDYGYISSDNLFVITGRQDEQIKLNGYRIELQGIENVLQSYGYVNDVATIFYNSKIIAYIVLSEDNSLKREGCIKYAKRNLPRHAIPHRFIFIKDMPYSRNGKRDKIYLKNLLQNEE